MSDNGHDVPPHWLAGMNEEEVEVDVRRARLTDAQLFYRVLSETFYQHGWLVSLHGSALQDGEGRDVDFLFTRYKSDALSIWEVRARFILLGIEPYIFAWRGEDMPMFGIVGTWHGIAVDFTFTNVAQEDTPKGG